MSFLQSTEIALAYFIHHSHCTQNTIFVYKSIENGNYISFLKSSLESLNDIEENYCIFFYITEILGLFYCIDANLYIC